MKINSKRLRLRKLLMGVWALLIIVSCSNDDTTSPPPGVTPEEETEQIGNEGGTVSLGGASIAVPAGYLPEPLPFTLSEKKSFAQDATYSLDPKAYQPIGVAWHFDTPLRSSIPLTLTISYKDQDIPKGFDAANLGVVQRVISYPEALGGSERFLPEPEVHYLPLPAVVTPESGTVSFELFGSGTYQLLAMSEPIETYAFDVGDVKTDGAMRAEEIDFRIHHSKAPRDTAAFNRVVREAIRAAHAKYHSLGFTLPEGRLRIVTVNFPDPTVAGAVAPANPHRIQLSSDLEDADELRRVVAHEYFHCTQFYNSNPLSWSAFHADDIWLIEGSAEWASDAVYDTIPGGYSAPTADRFRTSLDAKPPPKGGYDTVAFWKWLEANNPGTMWSILENQRLSTQDQSFANEDIAVISLSVHSYEMSLSDVHRDVQFLSFFRSSLFHKDYEEDETRVEGDDEDLWGPNRLGPPRELAPGLPEAGKTIVLSKGAPGDSEENPRSVDFELVHHLTADVFVVKNEQLGEHALDGILHVKFEPDPHGFFEVAVIAYNGTNVVEETSVSVSKTQGAMATVGIDEVTEVAVIAVDPLWSDVGRGTSQCEVWVAEESPCGELEEPILEIDNVEALQAALESPPSSGSIRLAPGTYFPQSREWDDVVDPQYDKRYANLMLNGVTLAGSTEGETRIVLLHIPEDRSLGIFVQGNACVRDLTIDGSIETGNVFYVANVQEFEMCNVTITDNSQLVGNDTFFYQAWDPGTFNISVHYCTFSCPNFVNDWYSGIYFSPFRWSSTGGPAPVINFELKKTEFYNLGCGVGFNNSDPVGHGTIVIDTDCYFFSNTTRHVYDWGSGTEHCP